jgi:hypothetical protein
VCRERAGVVASPASLFSPACRSGAPSFVASVGGS